MIFSCINIYLSFRFIIINCIWRNPHAFRTILFTWLCWFPKFWSEFCRKLCAQPISWLTECVRQSRDTWSDTQNSTNLHMSVTFNCVRFKTFHHTHQKYEMTNTRYVSMKRCLICRLTYTHENLFGMVSSILRVPLLSSKLIKKNDHKLRNSTYFCLEITPWASAMQVNALNIHIPL